MVTDLVLDERGELPRILGEVKADGTTLRYAYGPDGVAAQQRVTPLTSDPVVYPLLDALGSVRLLTDGTGAMTLASVWASATARSTCASATTCRASGASSRPTAGTAT